MLYLFSFAQACCDQHLKPEEHRVLQDEETNQLIKEQHEVHVLHYNCFESMLSLNISTLCYKTLLLLR